MNDNECKVPISVTSNNQQGVNTNKWFSKNRFAPLTDISPGSHCDVHKVLPFKHTHNSDKGSTNKGHKVGVARGERHTVIQSVSTSQTSKSPIKNSLGPGKDAHTQDKYDLDLRFHSRHRQKVASAKNCDTFKLWD